LGVNSLKINHYPDHTHYKLAIFTIFFDG